MKDKTIPENETRQQETTTAGAQTPCGSVAGNVEEACDENQIAGPFFPQG
jgi:hypothetical protein